MSFRMRLGATALAGIGLVSGAAHAQSSLTIYGALDVGVDRTSRGQGNVQGTVFGAVNGVPVPNAVAAPRRDIYRASTSASTQSLLGFRGSEDLGGGFVARFQLESTIVPDTGSFGNDGRAWGRTAFVGLTTPWGELRLGRQAAPMLAAYSFATTEELGTTDLMGSGLVVNNLQTRQDNMLSYGLKAGPWLAIASLSPNAGVAEAVSAARAGSNPAPSPAVGQILGGATAGGEGRGRTVGAMVAYITDEMTLTGAVHKNRFGVPIGLATPVGLVPLFSAIDYQSFLLSGKVVLSGTKTVLGANFYSGQLEEAGNLDPKIRAISAGVKQPFGDFDVGFQATKLEFTNFTRGKDVGGMLTADYRFSKRTALYLRAGFVKDSRGTPVNASVTPVPLAGGPGVALVPLGMMEIPLFAGGGLNMDARTSIATMGIRHSF